MGCVYRATNLLNGQCYIGKTHGSLEKRRGEHYSEVPQTYFHRALRKYGRANFEWDILFESADEDNLYRKERLYIRLFNTLIPNGYNMTTGGDGQYSRMFPSSWRDTNMKRAIDSGTPCYCVELDRVYRTGAEAYKDTGVTCGTIRQHCREPFRKARKYHFCNATEVEMRILRNAYLNDDLSYGKHITEQYRQNISLGQKRRNIQCVPDGLRCWLTTHPNPMLGKKMSKVSLAKAQDTKRKNGVSYVGSNNPASRSVINTTDGHIFDTMKSAAEYYQLPSKATSNISSACTGRIKTAYGYTWAYYMKDQKGDT